MVKRYLWILILKPMFHGKGGVLLRLVRAWKLQCQVRTGCARELTEILKNKWLSTFTRINIKRIQSSQLQNDLANPNVFVLQIDFAMNYSCEYQYEVQSALWSRESVMLFMCKLHCKIPLMVSDGRDKGKDTVAEFIDFLCESCCAHKSEKYNIWSDRPTSEFKNKFMVKFLQILSQKYQQSFSWKYLQQVMAKG